MRFLYEASYLTPLSKSDVKLAIIQVLKTRKKNGQYRYIGYYDEGVFQIIDTCNGSIDLSPMINGVMKGKKDETHLDIKVRPTLQAKLLLWGSVILYMMMILHWIFWNGYLAPVFMMTACLIYLIVRIWVKFRQSLQKIQMLLSLEGK